MSTKIKTLIDYLTKQQKTKITKEYNKGIGINKIAEDIEEPKRVVKEYLEANGAIVQHEYQAEVHGHIQFTDFYSSYKHQYIMAKELETDIFTIKRYYVHHKNGVKTDNSIGNLWLFYDNATHIFYHSLYSKGEISNSLDELYLFNYNRVKDYLDDLKLDREQEVLFNQEEFDRIEEELNTYLYLIKKLYNIQKELLQDANS